MSVICRTAAILLLATAPPVSAQSLAADSLTVANQSPAVKPISTWNLVTPGAALGLAGFAAGVLIGAGLSSECTGDTCQLAPAFLGGALLGTLGMSLGVHLGNHRRGSFALDALAGAAVWTGGIVLASVSGEAQTAVLVLIPIAQLVTNVAVERAVGRKRAQALPVVVSLLPGAHGGMNVTASLRF